MEFLLKATVLRWYRGSEWSNGRKGKKRLSEDGYFVQ